MTNPYLIHPNEEALERFLRQRSDEGELETIETNIMACESCVTRLELMETQIADLKTALVAHQQEQIERALHPQPSFWKKWLTVPHLSWAGAACAAVAAVFLVTPGMLHQNAGALA